MGKFQPQEIHRRRNKQSLTHPFDPFEVPFQQGVQGEDDIVAEGLELPEDMEIEDDNAEKSIR